MKFTLHRAVVASEWLSLYKGEVFVKDMRDPGDIAEAQLLLYTEALKEHDVWTPPTSDADVFRMLRKKGYYISRTELSRYEGGKLRTFTFEVLPLP